MVRHAFVNPKSDGGDATIARPTDWNADHDLDDAFLPLGDNYSADAYPASPNSLDDEFEGGGSIDGKWTIVNNPAGGNAFNQTSFPGYLWVGLNEIAVTDDFATMAQLYQTAPTGTSTMTYIAKVAMANSSGTNALTDAAEFAGVGIALINSTNSEAVGAGIQFNDAVATDADKLPQQPIGFSELFSGFGTTVTFLGIPPSDFVYIRLRKTTASAYTSSNTYEMDFSRNGIIWQNIASGSKTFTTACDRVGLLFRRPKIATGTPFVEVIVDFFRRVS